MFDETGKLVLSKVEQFIHVDRPKIFEAPQTCPEDLEQVRALTEYASQVDDVLKIMGLSYDKLGNEPKTVALTGKQQLTIPEQVKELRQQYTENPEDQTEQMRLLDEHVAVDRRLDKIKE